MNETVLFNEYVGGGDDVDNYLPNGITVVLGRWDTDNYRLRSHYTLQARVMIARQIVVDELEIERDLFQGDAAMIRKAIARMDQLKALNPECRTPEELVEANNGFASAYEMLDALLEVQEIAAEMFDADHRERIMAALSTAFGKIYQEAS